MIGRDVPTLPTNNHLRPVVGAVQGLHRRNPSPYEVKLLTNDSFCDMMIESRLNRVGRHLAETPG
jgi:hypothetical protein